MIYSAPADRPAELEPIGPTGLTACVWDMPIMAFEREAWLDAVLKNPDGPDLERYLEVRFDGDV